jgi:diaminopimelate epimerase
MHGLGNDFILLQPSVDLSRNYGSLSRKLCHRRLGIGADGLILVSASNRADVKMRIFNSDGSEAMMCGNGIRCLALYAREKGLVTTDSFTVETKAGLRFPEILRRGDNIYAVRVDMGEPGLRRADIPMKGRPEEQFIEKPLRAGKETFRATCVSIGNPHCVIFTEGIRELELASLGRAIETHSLFPDRTNVEFVQVMSPGRLQVRAWERGAGETSACGTGACAALVAASITGRSRRKALVNLPGGTLSVEWRTDNTLRMTGPATTVFEGEMPD